MAPRFAITAGGSVNWSSTGTWSASTGGATGVSVPGAADTVTIDAASGSGTVVVDTTVNCVSIVMDTAIGTLDALSANSGLNNVTLNTFSSNGTSTRTLNMGNGTWAINGTSGTVWNMLTTTGFTFNKNGSTLVFAGTPSAARTFTPGTGKSYSIVSLSALPSVGATFIPLVINQSCTIDTLNMAAPQWLIPVGTTTVTITNAVSWNGSSASPLVLSSTNGAGGTLALAAGSTIDHACLFGLTITGSPTITNSVGAVSGPTILPPGGSKFIGG